MNSPRSFVIVTANTYLGQTTRDIGGLDALASADVLLLQEVINPERDKLEAMLAQAGFTLVHAAARFGLAIALRTDSSLRVMADSVREHKLARLGLLETVMVRIWAGHSHKLTQRGMLSVKLQANDGYELTVVTTHPAVDVTPRSRARQIAAIGVELTDSYYDGPLVLGGDMNHYPAPKDFDKALWAKAGLTATDLAGEASWRARGSDMQIFMQIGAFFTRRSLEAYDGQLDILLYRGLTANETTVVDIPSDHRAIMTRFSY